MKISWNWLTEYVDLSSVASPEKLQDILTARGLEIETIEKQDRGFEKVVSAQILERNAHPQSDRLSLCLVSTGVGVPLEIVCGAQNMKAGDKVALAQIGADLPNGMKISAGKIRGVVSNGMLCSEEELKLKDSSEGILILAPETPVGKPLAEILGLNDTILTFKLYANRGDCLSHFGMAREIAAALGVKAKRPEGAKLPGGKLPITIGLGAGELAPQFFGVAIDGVNIGPSPAWLVKRLEAVGSRSINNVVDASNYVMLELGQPLHAYDATLIEGAQISVREARAGEELPLLDGTTIQLLGGELVIADATRAVGLAGVMGGGNSEVRDSTTRLFLEAAEFNASSVRRASSKHMKKTDAAQRFERGVDPSGVELAIARLAKLITELAGGRIVASGSEQMPSRKPFKPVAIEVDPVYFGKFLGMKVSPDDAEKVFLGLECKLEKGTHFKVSPPSYRLDLNAREDLAEEVARTLGYDKIEETIPVLTNAPSAITADASSAKLGLLNRAKDLLAAQGLIETLNFSFTSQNWLEKFGLKSSVPILNPLSEDLGALVPSLIPDLVKNALDNSNHHFGSEQLALRLFQIRPTFHATGPVAAQGEMESSIRETWKMAFAISGPRFASGMRSELGVVDFYDLKAILENIFEGLGARGMRMQAPSESSGANPVGALFHPGQSVEILAGKDVAGYAGLLHPAKERELKFRSPLWICEIDWEMLSKLARPVTESRAFKAIPSFPPMERDFALLVKNDVTADKIAQVALKAGRPLAKTAKIFDVYRGSQVAEGMTSVAVRVIFYDESRSLQEAEAEAASAQILELWKKELGAVLR